MLLIAFVGTGWPVLFTGEEHSGLAGRTGLESGTQKAVYEVAISAFKGPLFVQEALESKVWKARDTRGS